MHDTLVKFKTAKITHTYTHVLFNYKRKCNKY